MKSPEKQIAETIPEFFFIWDLNKNEIIHITDSFDTVSVQPKQSDNLAAIRQIIASDQLERFNKAFEEIENGNYFQDIEFQTANVFNGTKWVNMKTYPVKVEDGEIVNIAGQFVDITEKKQRQEKIEKQSEEIEDILHILAHDVRGPLGNILNIAKAQKLRNADEIDVIRNFSALVEKIAGNTLFMIESMIETVKVTSLGFTIEAEKVDLQSFMENILSGYSNNLTEKQITLNTHFSSNRIEIDIDEVKFRLVIHNLLTNAIKFTHNGGIIYIKTRETGQSIEIQVTDTGVGIPKENLESIFRKFSPVRRDGIRGEKSFGLGLSISKKIVELHNGTIKVNSKLGEGTTFTITLPKRG